MVRKVFRGMLIGVVTAIVALICVADTHGVCGWLQQRYNAAAAMYGNTACNPCGQQLTCNYVPQTCYRVQYVNVPVTTYRPVASCDPCSGCQTVCMKPTTCYQQRAQYVPYTTYRLVYSVSQPACAATTSYYAPATAGVAPAAAPSGCSSCGTGVATTSYYAPNAGAAPAPAAGYAYTYPSQAGYSSSYRYAPSYGATTTVAPAPTSSYPVYSGPTYTGPAYTGSPNGATLAVPQVGGAAMTPPSLPMTTNYAPTVAPPTTVTSPAQVETKKVETKIETKVEKPAADGLTPIPDPMFSEPKLEGPSLNMNKTSTPRLFDPQDKTAAAWPTERAWGYAPVGARVASQSAVVPVAAAEANEQAVRMSGLEAIQVEPRPMVERSPITQGPIVPRAAPAADTDGWHSSNR